MSKRAVQRFLIELEENNMVTAHQRGRGQSRHPIHVGIWLDIDGGGMLHCMQGAGVVFQNLHSLSLTGWKIENYYRYKSELVSSNNRSGISMES